MVAYRSGDALGRPMSTRFSYEWQTAAGAWLPVQGAGSPWLAAGPGPWLARETGCVTYGFGMFQMGFVPGLYHMAASAAYDVKGEIIPADHANSFFMALRQPAGVVACFAPFNVPKARMFLGDVGSYFIGAWLAAGVTPADCGATVSASFE